MIAHALYLGPKCSSVDVLGVRGGTTVSMSRGVGPFMRSDVLIPVVHSYLIFFACLNLVSSPSFVELED